MESLNVNILHIADWIVQKARLDEEAGDLLTHLKLQKLLYYAQAWAMVILGKSLFTDEFEAWAHGPVNRKVWDILRDAGRQPIEAVPGGDASALTDAAVVEVLEEVWAVYGSKTARALENLSHSEQPWLRARGNREALDACQTVIRKEDMLAFYKQFDQQAA